MFLGKPLFFRYFHWLLLIGSSGDWLIQMLPEPSGRSRCSGFHLIVISHHVIFLVSCDSSCDFADVLMTLSLGSADLVMGFDWL